MVIGVAGLARRAVVGGLVFLVALGLRRAAAPLDTEAHASRRRRGRPGRASAGCPTRCPVAGAAGVQVVDAHHRVIAGSRRPPTGSCRAARPRSWPGPGPVSALLVDGAGSGGRAGAGGRGAGRPADDPVSVLVAVPIGGRLATRTALRTALLIAFPLLVALLAAVAWRVVGATLRPVEALRVRRRGHHRQRARPARLPVPAAGATRSTGSRSRSTACSTGSTPPGPGSGRSSADAAHELRSPLTNMRTQLEVAQRLGEGRLAGRRRDLLADVQRLTRLVDDLLLLARADDDARAPAHARAGRRSGAAGRGGRRVPGRLGVRRGRTGPLWTVGDAGRAAAGRGQPARQRGTARPRPRSSCRPASTATTVVRRSRRRPRHPGRRPGAGLRPVHPARRRPRPRRRRRRARPGHRARAGPPRRRRRVAGDADPPWSMAAVIRLPATRSTASPVTDAYRS